MYSIWLAGTYSPNSKASPCVYSFISFGRFLDEYCEVQQSISSSGPVTPITGRMGLATIGKGNRQYSRNPNRTSHRRAAGSSVHPAGQ